MRNAFADEILNLALLDPRIVVLSGDIGNRLFDKFKAAMPTRFYNCGVAEANMISLAAGLASSGLRPVCYTITPFVTTRCLEQIKLDVCYHEMPVTIVGTGSGLSYAALGSTHHSFEDIAIMRALPGMRVLAPADPAELRRLLRESLSQSCPSYLRIGKKGEPDLTSGKQSDPGRWQHLHEGHDATILSCGTILSEALPAVESLSASGINVGLWNCAYVKPLDLVALDSLPRSLVFSIEEHSVLGGFGSAVAEVFCSSPMPRRLHRIGIPDRFLHDTGEQHESRIHCGLDSTAIVNAVTSALG